MKNSLLKIIYTFFIRGFLKLIVGIKFPQANFLKSMDQFIIVANHNSHLDTMTLLASLPASVLPKVKPVAAKDHFGKSRLSTFLSNTFINTLLIQRKRDKENPDKDPIHNMIKALDEGYSLILFPEGTRGQPEVEEALKPGIGLLLQERPNIPIVPAYMKGMGMAMPKGDGLILPFNAQLLFGKPKRLDSTDISEVLYQLGQEFKMLKSLINA
jgi:1-acyl-sn-glycerol-3-phosphate acyltransferase